MAKQSAIDATWPSFPISPRTARRAHCARSRARNCRAAGSLTTGSSKGHELFSSRKPAPYPRRLTFGSLLISPHSAIWAPYLQLPWRNSVAIDFVSPATYTRSPDFSEPNVDHGQKLCDGVIVSKWLVLTARESIVVDFVVPFPDVPLLCAWLNNTI